MQLDTSDFFAARIGRNGPRGSQVLSAAAPLPRAVGLILHFRLADRTQACVRSLLAEGIREILVIDNSEDEGVSLRTLRADLSREAEAQVIYVEPGRNLGFSVGVNRGLDEIRRRFGYVCVLLINNDANLCAGAYSALRKELRSSAGLVVPQMRMHGKVSVSLAYYHRATGALFGRRTAGAYAYASGCCMLIGPDLAAAPLFDEDFFFYGDDAELGWRMARMRRPQHVASDAIAEHAPSSGSRNGSLFYEYHMIRAHWLLANKVANGRTQAALFMLGRAVFLPARSLWRAAGKRSATPLVALAMATLDVMRGRMRTLTPPA